MKFCTLLAVFLLCSLDSVYSFYPVGRVYLNGSAVANEPSSSSAVPRIYGGSQASSREFPFQGLYFVNGFQCGCSIISSRWAITAAHCTRGISASRMTLHFGTINRISAPRYTLQSFGVTLKIEHPSYRAYSNGQEDYDVALLRLDKSATWTSYVQPILIPSDSAPINRMHVIAGWGTTSTSGSSSPTILRKAYVPVISNSLCSSWLRKRGITIRSNHICAGYWRGGVDTCQGDSGGPLALYDPSRGKYYLHGITSFGYGCGLSQTPGVYARVTSFRYWISRYTGVSASSTQNRCSPNPCQNGGRCYTSSYSPYYRCYCRSGYYGSTCSIRWSYYYSYNRRNLPKST